MNMDGAYWVQTALMHLHYAEGQRKISWNIGLTSKAMQMAPNINMPDSGVLLNTMAFETAETIPKGRFIEPRIEAEITLIMKHDLQGANVSRSDVIVATDYITPSLKILDMRILRLDPKTGRTRMVLDTISNNAANAGIVLSSERHQLDAVNPRWVGLIVARNGALEETGLGAGVLNDPVKSVCWLARRMDHYGDKISPEDLVLSGSFTRPIKAEPSSHFHADFGSFGVVEVTFAQ
jgi:2-oxo-hept-3-ene-1,7-dioate hydratase|tara:strand:+ start:4463 stop:5170 length:708 start_codon:yes stop_codon:yes gene_type:complete